MIYRGLVLKSQKTKTSLAVRTKSKSWQTNWNVINNTDQAALSFSFTSDWLVVQGTCKIKQEKTNTIHNYNVKFLLR